MADSLPTYLQDHLAGATFAVHLLKDLAERAPIQKVADLAARLRPDIEADRTTLQNLIKQHRAKPSLAKKTTSWLAEKVSLAKLGVGKPFGAFEAIELLALGVQGKLALWTALQAVANGPANQLNLPHLIDRALAQHHQLETLRIDLVKDGYLNHNSRSSN